MSLPPQPQPQPHPQPLYSAPMSYTLPPQLPQAPQAPQQTVMPAPTQTTQQSVEALLAQVRGRVEAAQMHQQRRNL